ncbi:MAG: hypothetical protein E7231_10145 [Cellulosilyticum sp.]|nr:hypothetical protein [Cellulosilyticum sp.]
MKRLSFERIGIVLFCATLIGSGALTLATGMKPIAKATLSGIKTGYTSDGVGGMLEGGISGLESGVNDNVYAKNSYVNLFGLTSKILNKKYIIETNVTNSVVKDSQGKLQFVTFPVDTQPYVDKIAGIKSVLDELGTPLLYVQTPLKVINGYDEMPIGITDSAETNTNHFMQQLDAAGITRLDLRENVSGEDLDLGSLFYNTDHHWTTQTAFWAVGEVVDYLKANMGIDLDPNNFYTNAENYTSKFYEDSFLGSQGRRVGKYYGGVDDYTLMLPNYDTDYSVTINKANASTTAEGTFEDALVKYNLLNTEDIFTNRYAAYFGADFPEVIVKNKSADNDMKVLIFKDSFGLPFSAFLSTMVGETRLLDTRYYDGDVQEYIKEYNPDLVLYVYKSINTQA